jgi:hypothetical protein
MKDFPNTRCNLAAAAILLGTSMAATAASEGVTGARSGSLRGYEQHKPADSAGGRGAQARGCRRRKRSSGSELPAGFGRSGRRQAACLDPAWRHHGRQSLRKGRIDGVPLKQTGGRGCQGFSAATHGRVRCGIRSLLDPAPATNVKREATASRAFPPPPSRARERLRVRPRPSPRLGFFLSACERSNAREATPVCCA